MSSDKSKSKNIETTVEKTELGMRILFAIIAGTIFAVIGFTAGALIWSGIGVILALVLFPIGALYGFFCDYINAILRSFLNSFLE